MLTVLAALPLAQAPLLESGAEPAPSVLASAPVSVARTELAPLDQAALEFAQLAAARSPWLAVERAIPSAEPLGLGVFGGPAASERRRELEDLARRIELLAIDERAAAERDALAAAVTVERILSDPWRAERWNALEWVERAERTLRVESAVAADAEVLAGILAELPESFAEAERTLEPCPNPWRAAALAALTRLEGLVASLDLGSAAEREVVRARALAACRRFAGALSAAREADARRPRALGEARWLELVGAAAGWRGTVAELEASLLGDLARRERDGGRLASFGAAPAATGEARASEPSVEEVALEVARAAWKVRFAPLFGEVDPPALTVRADDLPALLGRDALFLARSPERAEVLVDPHGLAARGEAAWRRAVLRTGIPGQALLCAGPLRGARPAALHARNRALVEGWGWLVLADADRDEGSDAADSAAELGFETLRLLAALDAHARGLPLERVAERLARRCGLDGERALAEARRAFDDPLDGIGVLGLRELARLREASGDEHAFLATVLAHPDFRPTDLAPLFDAR